MIDKDKILDEMKRFHHDAPCFLKELTPNNQLVEFASKITKITLDFFIKAIESGDYDIKGER